MGILDVLFANSGKASRSRTPADRVDYPIGFRGELNHQTELCVGCTTCNYVCSPGAIQFQKSAVSVVWEYQAAQCTFCGKCVEYCPTHALSFHPIAPANGLGAESNFVTAHTVEYCDCKGCGEPVIPLPVPTIEHLYGGYPPEEMLALMRLCEKCRNRATVTLMKKSLTGQFHTAGVKK